jgi:hypothetical protein
VAYTPFCTVTVTVTVTVQVTVTVTVIVMTKGSLKSVMFSNSFHGNLEYRMHALMQPINPRSCLIFHLRFVYVSICTFIPTYIHIHHKI